MRFFVPCLLSLFHLLYARERVIENDHLGPVMRSVQEQYVKMKLAVMMDVNNMVTVVDMNRIRRKNDSTLTEDTIDVPNGIGFYFYSRKNREDPVEYRIDNITNLVNNGLFNFTEKTIVLVHGYLNNLTSPMIQLPLNALLNNYNVNVIAVDWYQVMAKQDNLYTWCAEDTFPVGQAVGLAISKLIGVGLKRHLTHLVGHSLGAHVVGIAGKYLNSLNQTIARITGLDAAKIGFESTPESKRINAGDAEFVDCIHSCGSYLAYDRPICQTDFYPNGGLVQPGCGFLGDICCVCSHGRSYRYFAESIIPKHTFPASKCFWTLDGLMGCYDSSQMMGYPAKSQYKGSYFVKTEPDYPFSPAIMRPPVPSLWSELQAWLLSFRLIIT